MGMPGRYVTRSAEAARLLMSGSCPAPPPIQHRTSVGFQGFKGASIKYGFQQRFRSRLITIPRDAHLHRAARVGARGEAVPALRHATRARAVDAGGGGRWCGGGSVAGGHHAAVRAGRRRRRARPHTAMKKLRIVILGFGTS
jgi:hypothetical protein